MTITASEQQQIPTEIVVCLTPQEIKVFWLLMRTLGIVDKDAIMAELYGDLAPTRKAKIVEVLICKMRSKIAKLGVTIDTVHGRGYRMPLSSRQKIGDIMREEGIAA